MYQRKAINQNGHIIPILITPLLSYLVCNLKLVIAPFLSVEEFNILSVPVTNTDFFEMYINWNNWNKEGVHQDLEYAYNLKIKILTTLRTRDIVKFGDGKFEDYDYKRLDKLCNG